MIYINKRLSDRIIKCLSVSDEASKLKISYYLESVFSELEKIIILMVMFTIFGYGFEGCVSIGVMLMLRPYLGGTHFKSFWKCFMATMIMCSIPIMLSRYKVSICVLLCVACVILLLITLYAPVKSTFRMEYYGKVLIKIRIKGVIMLMLLIALCILGIDTIRTLVTYTMIELIIDFVIAGSINGYSSVKK